MVNIDTLEKDLRFVDDVIYVEKTHNGTSVSDRLPAFGVMPGNILGAKLGVRDHDWGIVAPVEYRESINSIHLPIRNKGMHILDPMGNGKMVGLYENIIPGEVYVDWISLFMPRISTLDLYVSPSMFSMIKDVSKGKTDLMPHEHHMMTIWPRSWQGNNFLVTRGKIFETVGEGYVEIDGMLDGMELPLGLNDGIIHRDVKIKSMRRITSKMTIGAIHNNLVWNFTDDAVAYVPTISRPFAPTVMGQPFRHIENMPTSIEYVKEEYDEYVLAFSANKAMKLNLHSFMSHDFDYSHTENNTTLDRPWHAMKVSLKDSMINAKAYTGYQNKQDWFADISSLGLEDVSGEEFNFFGNNILKHFKKLNFGIIPVAHSQASRYRSKDTTLFKWNTDKPIKLKNFAYVPYNISDYSTYKTGSQNNIPTKKGVKSIYANNAEPSKFGFNEQDSFNTPDGGVIIDNSFMGIHEVRKLFPDDATVTIDKLIIPWLEESYEGNTLVKNMDVAIKPIKLKYENITNLSRLARVGDHELVDKYRTKSVKGLIMSSPLSYVINESSIGNLEDLKSKWNYQGGTMIFKRKGGATDLGRVGLDKLHYTHYRTDDDELIFYSPYFIPKNWIDEGRVKFRLAFISEETFKDEMHKGNGYYITDEKDDYISLDHSGRDFLYPDTLDREMFSGGWSKPPRFETRRNINMANYFFDNSDNINYGKTKDTITEPIKAHLNRCNIKRDYIQPEPTHKHTSELLKGGLWDFMRPNPTYDKLNLAYDIYEKNYSDYYNLASNNMGGSNRQLISYPKNIMMLSFASDRESIPYTLDTAMNDVEVVSIADNLSYWSIEEPSPSEYDLTHRIRQNWNYLTKIRIKDKKLLEVYKKAGPDASIVVVSNIPFILDGSSYIGGTFPLEEEYVELVNQKDSNFRFELISDSTYAVRDLHNIGTNYTMIRSCSFMHMSEGFELDDAFLEDSHLFRNLSGYMQDKMLYSNVLYRVNPHILEPMYRKGMIEFFPDIVLEWGNIEARSRHTAYYTTDQSTDAINLYEENEGYDDLHGAVNGFMHLGSIISYVNNINFPIVNLRWCMQFVFDNMPKTIRTIRGINLFDITYIPDSLFPQQINKVIMNPEYLNMSATFRENRISDLVEGTAIWINKPCENEDAVIEHNDLFKKMLVFTRNKNTDMYGETLDEYYEWSIDGKIDGIQYNATSDKIKMHIKSPNSSENMHYDMPFDMRVDELSDLYSKWTYADHTVNADDAITIRWEIDLVTKETPDVNDFESHRFDLTYVGKAKDLINWDGFKFNSGTHKAKLDKLNTYYIGSPVVRNIRVYSDVYVCPAPNWERGIWGILRGTLPPGTDTRCVVIPQRCTEGIFYRNVDLSKGIVLGEYNGSLPEKLFWGTKKEKLNVSGIFTSTHNANPHSHRTRKLTYRGFRANEGDMVFDDKFPSLWLNQNDIDMVSQKYRASIMGADRHDLVDKRYGINLYKLNTASIIIDDENSSNLEKTKETGLRSNLNVEMWRITKRTEFGTIYIKSNDKSYILNTRPSVATVNDVSPLSIPHKFDEIDISKLGGFGDLHEVYSDDPFGITPYAYINHRPIGIYNRGYKAQLTFDSIKSITNYRAMILISLMRAIRSTVNIGSDLEHQEIIDTVYNEHSSSGDTIYDHLERIGVKRSELTQSKVEKFRYPTDNYVFEAADKHMRNLFLVGWSRILKDSTIRASINYILKHKNKLFASDDRCTDFIVNVFKEQVDRTPNNFEDLWLNFTGKNIYEDTFRSTGDTTFPITSAIPVTSIFSKYTMLNGVAKTKNRNDYVFSEHRCGVLYDFYDRFVTSRFDQTEFDQSYYIIQSNIRRSNIYKVYHQGIDYKKGENYRYMSKGVFGYNAYENGLRMSDVIDRLYGTNDRIRTPNIRSVYTHGGENCTNRYSVSSMYYRSTLINETVGDILEIGSPMPLVGPLYYNLYQTNQIPLNFIVTIDKQKDPSHIMNLTNTSQSVIKSTYNPQIKKNQLINLAMNRSLGLYHIFNKAYGSKTIRDKEVKNVYYNKRRRAGIYKTIKEMFSMSPYILNGSIINQYKVTDIVDKHIIPGIDQNSSIPTILPYTKVSTSSIKIPEYYSNWAGGQYTSTSGKLGYGVKVIYGSKDVGLYNHQLSAALLLTDTGYNIPRNVSHANNKSLLFRYNFNYTPPHLYMPIENTASLVMRAMSQNIFQRRNGYRDTALSTKGFVYRSDFALHKDIGSSMMLNLKSYVGLLRSGGGKRFLYNNFIYPYSANYLDRASAAEEKRNSEIPYRVDTNSVIILSNIHSINSQLGDLDEVNYLEDVSNMISRFTVSEFNLNMRGFKSVINSPTILNPLIKELEVIGEYGEMLYTSLDYNKYKSSPILTSINKSLTKYNEIYYFGVADSIPDSSYLIVFSSSNDEICLLNDNANHISHTSIYDDVDRRFLTSFNYITHNYSKTLKLGQEYDLYDSEEYNDSPDNFTKGTYKYIKRKNKSFSPIVPLVGYTSKNPILSVSPISGRTLYRYSWKDNYPLVLSHNPCMAELISDRVSGTLICTLGRNRLNLVKAMGYVTRGINTSKYNLGRFNLFSVIPNSINANKNELSAWTNTDIVRRCNKTSQNHEIVISGQFLNSDVRLMNYAAQIIHRSSGKGKGYPVEIDNRGLKLNIERTFSLARITPNDPTAAYDGGFSLDGRGNNAIHFNYLKNDVYSDLYSLSFKFMQHDPIDSTLDIWEAPTDRVGNGLSHINRIDRIFEFNSDEYTSLCYTKWNYNKQTAEIVGWGYSDNNYRVDKFVLLFSKSPWYFSRPIYINNTTKYSNILYYTSVNRSRTPKLYDGAPYNNDENLMFVDIRDLKVKWPNISDSGGFMQYISDPTKDM